MLARRTDSEAGALGVGSTPICGGPRRAAYTWWAWSMTAPPFDTREGSIPCTNDRGRVARRRLSASKHASGHASEKSLRGSRGNGPCPSRVWSPAYHLRGRWAHDRPGSERVDSGRLKGRSCVAREFRTFGEAVARFPPLREWIISETQQHLQMLSDLYPDDVERLRGELVAVGSE